VSVDETRKNRPAAAIHVFKISGVGIFKVLLRAHEEDGASTDGNAFGSGLR